MRSTTTKLLVGATVLALALSACGSGSSSSSSSSKAGNQGAQLKVEYNKQPASNLKEGGTLNLSIGEITPQLNVFQYEMTADTQTLWDWYNPVLVNYTAEGDPIYVKEYVTSAKAEVKDSKTVVTYKLNDKATFNDGTPIDYKSFVNTWKSNIGAEGYESNSTDGYVLIENVTKGSNDKEVIVTYKQTYAWWNGLFNRVLHPAVDSAEKFTTGYKGGTAKSAHPEWGAGPYKLDSLDEKTGVVTFVPNELWWGDKAKLTKVTYQQRDAVAALNAFKNGETDLVGASSNENLAQIKSMTDIDIRRGSTPSNVLLTLNSDSKLLKDINLRKAIATGINREQIAQVAFNGLDYSEALPGSFTLFSYQKGYQDNFGKVVPKFDAAAAEKLLDDAGWKKGSDGIRAKDGTRLSLNLPIFGDAQLTKSRAQTTQAQMKAIGVELNVIAKPTSEFSKTMKAKDFDLTISGFASSDPYGVAYFCQIYCSDSTLNKSGTGNKALDAKIHEIEKIATADEQITKANEVEAEALGTYGLIPLYNGVTIYGAKKGLTNVGAGVFATDARGISYQKELIGYQQATS